MACFFTIEFWQNLTAQFFGSLGGVGVAILLYYLGNSYSETTRSKEETKTQNRKLQYIYTVIRKILSISIYHSKSFEEYSKLLEKDPIKFHHVKSNPTYELNRFTSKLNIEDYYLAYVGQIKNTEATSKFNEMVSTCEFAAFNLNDALRVNKEKLLNIYEKKVDFKRKFEAILFDLKSPEVQNQVWGDAVFESFLNDCFRVYSQRSSDVDDVAAAFSFVVEPLLAKLQINVQYRIGSMSNLFEKLNSAAHDYYAIKSDALVLKTTFDDFSARMSTACKTLINLMPELHDHLRRVGFKEKDLPKWPLVEEVDLPRV